MSETPKRFEDWYKVDCNNCSRWWDNSCDGVDKGAQRPCNSFIATRSIVLPKQIKRLEKRVNRLTAMVAGFTTGIFLGVLLRILGVW